MRRIGPSGEEPPPLAGWVEPTAWFICPCWLLWRLPLPELPLPPVAAVGRVALSDVGRSESDVLRPVLLGVAEPGVAAPVSPGIEVPPWAVEEWATGSRCVGAGLVPVAEGRGFSY